MRGNYAESKYMDVIIRRIKYVKMLIEKYPKND